MPVNSQVENTASDGFRRGTDHAIHNPKVSIGFSVFSRAGFIASTRGGREAAGPFACIYKCRAKIELGGVADLGLRSWLVRFGSILLCLIMGFPALGKAPLLGPKAKEYLDQENHSIPSDPVSDELQTAVESMTQKLRLPKDGNTPVQVVVVEDMRADVEFVRLSNGERILIVNTGLARMTRTPGELAFVVASEISHGITDSANSLKYREPGDTRPWRSRGFLNRVGDTDSEVRAVFERLNAKGYDPRESLSLTERMAATLHDPLESTTILWGSRRDALGVALTAYQRKYGGRLSSGTPDSQTESALRATLAQLESEGNVAKQRGELQRALALDPGAFLKFFEALKNNSSAEAWEFYYDEVLKKKRALLQKFGVGILSREEMIAEEIALQRKLLEASDLAYERVFGKSPILTTNHQISVIDRLNQHLHYQPGIPNFLRTYGSWRDAEDAVAKLEAEQGKATTLDDQQRIASRLKTAQEDRERAREEIRLARMFHEGSDLEALAEEHYDLSKDQNKNPSRGYAIEKEVKQRVKSLGPVLRERRARAGQNSAASVDVILGLLRNPTDEKLDSAIRAIQGLPEAVREKHFAEFVAAYYEGMVRAVDEAKDLKQLRGALHRGASTWFPPKAYLEKHGEPAAQAWTEAVRSLLKRVPKEDGSEWEKVYGLAMNRADLPAANKEYALTHGLGKDYSEGALQRLEQINASGTPAGAARNAAAMAVRLAEIHHQSHPGENPISDFAVSGVLSRMDALAASAGTNQASLVLRQHELLPLLAQREEFDIQDLWKQTKALLAQGHREGFEDLVKLFYGRVDEKDFYETVRTSAIDFESYAALGRSDLKEPTVMKNIAAARTGYSSFLSGQGVSVSAEKRAQIEATNLVKAVDPDLAKKLSSDQRKRFRDRIKELQKQYESHPMRERAKLITNVLSREFFLPFGFEKMEEQISGALFTIMPRDPADRLDVVLGYLDSVRAGAGKSRQEGLKYFIRTDWLDRMIRKGESLGEYRIESLIDAFFQRVGREDASSRDVDRLFEHIWERTEGHPALRAPFDDPELVRKLYYHENAKRLAAWQLEKRFGLDQRKVDVQRDVPSNDRVRPEVEQIHDFLQRQFPKRSFTKNELITHAQNKLVTNAAETKLLGKERIGLSTIDGEVQSALISALEIANRGIRSHYDRYDLIRYLVGEVEEGDLDFIRNETDRRIRKNKIEGLQEAHRRFSTADPAFRMAALQPLLDQREGILGDDVAREKLYRLILGEHYEDPMMRVPFEAYLASMDPAEKKVLVGDFVAGLPESKGKGLSPKRVLQGMGAFGAKVAQFLRTSTNISPKLRQELDEFFDRSSPPTRDVIVDKMHDIFGPNLRGVEHIMELAGSGSLNIAVVARIRDPVDGVVKKVIVRFQRDGVEGSIAHENGIWERAIPKISGSMHEGLAEMAAVLEAARRHAMRSLGPDGAELDLSRDREHHGAVAQAYDGEHDADSGLKTRAAKPMFGIQKLVPGGLQKTVSIYEYVPHTDLKVIEPGRRKAIAKLIVTKEFDNIFRKGKFDPDPHPGNWLIDLDAGEAVRVDTDQYMELTPQELKAMRSVFGALLSPKMGRGEIRALAKNIAQIFEGAPSLPDLERAIAEIVKNGDFPSFRAPHERLFFLQKMLAEKYSGVLAKRPLNFTHVTSSVLSAVGRANYYRDPQLHLLSDLEFAKPLIDAVGVGKSRFAVQAVSDWFGRKWVQWRGRRSPIPVSESDSCSSAYSAGAPNDWVTPNSGGK